MSVDKSKSRGERVCYRVIGECGMRGVLAAYFYFYSCHVEVEISKYCREKESKCVAQERDERRKGRAY